MGGGITLLMVKKMGYCHYFNISFKGVDWIHTWNRNSGEDKHKIVIINQIRSPITTWLFIYLSFYIYIYINLSIYLFIYLSIYKVLTTTPCAYLKKENLERMRKV